MTTTWKTKYGPRRVKREAPTIAEAFAAAQDMADGYDQQVELAASLLGIAVDEVRAAVPRMMARPKKIDIVAPAAHGRAVRTVVVERTPSRRVISIPKGALHRGV